MFDAKALLNSLLGGDSSGAMQQGGQILGQIGSAVAGAMAQAQPQVAGTQAGDLLGKATQMAADNRVATGAAASAAVAGLAAVLLGTEGGRSALGDTAKLGGLAALGGLAYKAFSNYQAGRPLAEGVPVLDKLTTPTPAAATPPAPPPASGFHADDHSQDAALVMLRAAIATAAADGVVDPGQRAKLLTEMQGLGVDPEAAKFLDAEIARPATPDQLAAAVGGSTQLALQVYTASRIIASPSSAPEQAFLAMLAHTLKLDPGLIAQVNAAIGAHA